MHIENTEPEHALFFFPHQDDEYAASSWIARERAAGARVSCLYLTDGASNVAAEIRDAESRGVLASLDIAPNDIVILNDGQRIGDGKLAANAERAWTLVAAWCAENPNPTRVYAPAWEGGHPDHDAAHVIALLAARQYGILASAWQFSLYHGYRTFPHPLFRVLSPLAGTASRRTIRHTFAEGWRHARLCWRYPSQRRTWMGLFPEAFVRRVILRRESVTAFDPQRVFERPHEGRLLYERLFGMRYEDMREHLAPLLRRIAERKSHAAKRESLSAT